MAIFNWKSPHQSSYCNEISGFASIPGTDLSRPDITPHHDIIQHFSTMLWEMINLNTDFLIARTVLVMGVSEKRLEMVKIYGQGRLFHEMSYLRHSNRTVSLWLPRWWKNTHSWKLNKIQQFSKNWKNCENSWKRIWDVREKLRLLLLKQTWYRLVSRTTRID